MAGIQVVLAQPILSLNSLLPLNSDHSYLLSVLANVLGCCSKYLHSSCVTRPFPCPFFSLNSSWYWIVYLWLWSAVTFKVLSESCCSSSWQTEQQPNAEITSLKRCCQERDTKRTWSEGRAFAFGFRMELCSSAHSPGLVEMQCSMSCPWLTIMFGGKEELVTLISPFI